MLRKICILRNFTLSKLLNSPFSVMFLTFFTLQGTQRALRHSRGVYKGVYKGHLDPRRALEGHLKHLGTQGTRGTLFSRLFYS